MDSTRRRELLITFLRWLVFSGLMAVTWDRMPRHHLFALGCSVFFYSAVTTLCLASGKLYQHGGRIASVIARMLDIGAIAVISAYANTPESTTYFAYVFVIVGSGLTARNGRRITLVAIASLAACVTSTLYSLDHSYSLFRTAEMMEMQGLVLAFAWLISLYVASVRSQSDVAHERESQLGAILSCGSRLTSFRTVNELSEHVLKVVVSETNALGGELWLVDECLSGLKPEANYSKSDSKDSVGSPEIPVKAYANWVANTATELVIGVKGRGHKNVSFADSKRPVIAVPLLWQSKESETTPSVFGVIVVWGASKSTLAPDALNALRLVGAMSSGAIVNLLLYRNLQKSFVSTLQDLVEGLEARNDRTLGHSERVMQVSSLIGRRLGVSAEALSLLHDAALLHDIGKISVPEIILNKTDELTLDEWQTMQQHPVLGEEICRSAGLQQEVQFLIRHHHEYLDGRGYPDGLAPHQLPMLQRILAVADTFDDMRSQSSYGNATFRSELNKAAGRRMDPTVVDALLNLIDSGEIDEIYQDCDSMVAGPNQDHQVVQLRVA